MKNRLAKIIILGGLLLSPMLMTGCVTSAKSEAIRSDLKNKAVAELQSAAKDVKKIALRDLTTETVEKTTMVDGQYRAALDALKANNVDSTENVVMATEKYMKERDRVRAELLDRAQFYTNLLIKIDNGWLSIESLEKMNQAKDEARKSLIVDVMSKDIPVVLASFYASGKIDPEFMSVIAQYLGSAVPVSKPVSETSTNPVK